MISIGLGCNHYSIGICIENAPPLTEYRQLDSITPLINDEIRSIGQQCGNGWRKVFNVYAKLLFALPAEKFTFSKLADSWQDYRDLYLLQAHSKTALLFTPPVPTTNSIHIIAGRTYAKKLLANTLKVPDLIWLNEEFAISKNSRLIVSPYLDYRQLSNIKIEFLVKLINQINE